MCPLEPNCLQYSAQDCILRTTPYASTLMKSVSCIEGVTGTDEKPLMSHPDLIQRPHLGSTSLSSPSILQTPPWEHQILLFFIMQSNFLPPREPDLAPSGCWRSASLQPSQRPSRSLHKLLAVTPYCCTMLSPLIFRANAVE